MARLVNVVTFNTRVKHSKVVKNKAGSLSIIENFDIGFTPKRVYWLYGLLPREVRAGHRHLKTRHAFICVRGSCKVFIDNGKEQRGATFALNRPDECLILDAKDWHTMQKFKKGTVLLVLASTNYDPKDYVYEPYQ